MGTRSTYPKAEHLKYFTPTDEGWPQFIRICPLLDWGYCEIWNFIKKLELPYCPLYDKGYSSIGGKHNTKQNPKLQNGDTYLPAHCLQEENEERSGRDFIK